MHRILAAMLAAASRVPNAQAQKALAYTLDQSVSASACSDPSADAGHARRVAA